MEVVRATPWATSEAARMTRPIADSSEGAPSAARQIGRPVNLGNRMAGIGPYGGYSSIGHDPFNELPTERPHTSMSECPWRPGTLSDVV